MLPEFRSQLFQLPLITTTWTSARKRYIQEKENSLVPIRFILSIIEQAILLVHRTVIRPLPSPYHTYCKLFLSVFYPGFLFWRAKGISGRQSPPRQIKHL
jgi:hypothetical protein